MITTNVFQRVFHIRYGKGTATSFVIDVDGRQYLVTAKHVLEEFQSGDNVELYYNGIWTSIVGNLVGHHTVADVSVIAVNQILAINPMEPSSAGLIYGQDTYFLGFPYMLQHNIGLINRNFPMPLVKKAIVSAIMFKQTDMVDYLLLDGYNNPGFSGGPVVFKPAGSKDFKVAAIISGYRYDEEPTFLQDQETPIVYRANTGIIIAYSIKNAVELIQGNPIGVEIDNT